MSSPIAVIRTALGLDAVAFAKLVGCGKSTIQHVETGRPLKAELADKIHLVTGVPREWLDRDALDVNEVQKWAEAREKPLPILDRTIHGACFAGENNRFAAIHFCMANRGINPALAALAVNRALDDVIRRFNLDPTLISEVEQWVGVYGAANNTLQATTDQRADKTIRGEDAWIKAVKDGAAQKRDAAEAEAFRLVLAAKKKST